MMHNQLSSPSTANRRSTSAKRNKGNHGNKGNDGRASLAAACHGIELLESRQLMSAASFVATDSTTKGSWQGTYGSQGADVIGGSNSLPSYAALTTTGASAWTWASTTTDPRAPLSSSTSTNRNASGLYSASSLSVGLNLTDGQQHQVALYLLDWDSQNRSENVEVFDSNTGKMLANQSVSNFNGGKYLEFNVSGNVYFRLTGTGGPNAMLNGLFIDPVGGAVATPTPTPTPTPTVTPTQASLLGVDSTTKGSWLGSYGSQGADIIGGSNSLPSYALINTNGASSWTWVNGTTDSRALSSSSTSSSHIAAGLYSSGNLNVGLNLTDGQQHQVALYLLDWDTQGRSETIDVLDSSTGRVLASQTVAGFTGGKYVNFNVSGNVTFRLMAGSSFFFSY